MKNWIGKYFIIIGLIHTFFGFIVFRAILAELASEMLFNTIDEQMDRNAIFWFLFTGFLIMIIGGLIHWIESQHHGLPSFLKWSFGSLTVIGCIIMPISGFWLLLVPTIGLFLQKKRGDNSLK